MPRNRKTWSQVSAILQVMRRPDTVKSVPGHAESILEAIQETVPAKNPQPDKAERDDRGFRLGLDRRHGHGARSTIYRI